MWPRPGLWSAVSLTLSPPLYKFIPSRSFYTWSQPKDQEPFKNILFCEFLWNFVKNMLSKQSPVYILLTCSLMNHRIQSSWRSPVHGRQLLQKGQINLKKIRKSTKQCNKSWGGFSVEQTPWLPRHGKQQSLHQLLPRGRVPYRLCLKHIDSLPPGPPYSAHFSVKSSWEKSDREKLNYMSPP